MKKTLFTLILLAFVQQGWAQTMGRYTERLDSIVVRHKENPHSDEKQSFFYNDQGRIRQINYYANWDNKGWVLTNKREYYQNAAGKDTLLLIYNLSKDVWKLTARQRFLYDDKGLLTSEYWYNEDGGIFQNEYSYDEEGRMTHSAHYSGRNGERKLRNTHCYMYDAQGHLIAISGGAHPDEQNKSVLRYDPQGRLIARSDSTNNGTKEFREWRSREYTYQDSLLRCETQVLSTIEHGQINRVKSEKRYDEDGDLVEDRRIRQEETLEEGWEQGQLYGEEKLSQVQWHSFTTYSYLYDKTVSRDSVCGLYFLDGEDSPQFQHKLLKERLQFDDEDVDYESETTYYYSPLHE